MIPEGKGGRCVELTTLPPSCVDCIKIWQPQTCRKLGVCPGLYKDGFNFTFICLCNDFSLVKKPAYVGSDYCN